MLSKQTITASLILSIFVTTPITSWADKLGELRKAVDMLKKCVELPEGPEQDACDRELEMFESQTSLSCNKLTNQEEKISCFFKYSAQGNGDISYELGKAYEGKSFEIQGLPINKQEAIRLKLLGFQQGALSAKQWYYREYIPPQPYKWEVGMSKNQVLHSVDGEPHKVIKVKTTSGETEVWYYTGATLYFGPKSKGGLLEVIVDQE